jgi:hypothetical protein
VIRIAQLGAKVVIKSGWARIVWGQWHIHLCHEGCVQRCADTDEILFLTVSGSLCDLWTHSVELDWSVVFPKPEIGVFNGGSWMTSLPYHWNTWTVECV